MNHRHLLPAEIDLLLDEEVGFGVSPLRAHVQACADCRARQSAQACTWARSGDTPNPTSSSRSRSISAGSRWR